MLINLPVEQLVIQNGTLDRQKKLRVRRLETMKAAFTKQKNFPLIGKIIDGELLINDSADRDVISKKLLNQPEVKEILPDALLKYKTDDPSKVSGKMVDWFSAEITSGSKYCSALD